jgi:hypothetical protein
MTVSDRTRIVEGVGIMPSLAVVIGFEALAKASANPPVARRRRNPLRRRAAMFWSALRAPRVAAAAPGPDVRVPGAARRQQALPVSGLRATP